MFNQQNGKGVGDVVGSDAWSSSAADTLAAVTIAGIPSDATDLLTTTTSANTGRGTLIDDTGGYEQGGPSSGTPSYSDVWNSPCNGAFATAVADAVAHESRAAAVASPTWKRQIPQTTTRRASDPPMLSAQPFRSRTGLTPLHILVNY